MSRFRKLSHTIWHCQYHVIWVPKYRYWVLHGEIAGEVAEAVRAFSDRMGCEVMELSVQVDHVHLQVMVRVDIRGAALVG